MMQRAFSALEAAKDERVPGVFARLKAQGADDPHVRCLKYRLGLAKRPQPTENPDAGAPDAGLDR